jgi:acetolactate synthase regulatory subunit
MSKTANYLLTVSATQNAYLLGRMLNILTRSRIPVEHISSSLITNDEQKYHINAFNLVTDSENAEKISKQMKKLVEVMHVQLQVI